MISTRALTLLLASFSSNAAIAAQQQDVPDNSVVEAAVAAIEDSDEAALRGTFSAVHNPIFRYKVVDTPAEAIELLAGCDAEEVDRNGMPGFYVYAYKWTCPEEVYFVEIIPDQNGRSLAFHDLVTKAHLEYRRTLPTVPPPVPVQSHPTTAEESAKAAKERELRIRQREAMIGLEFKNGGWDAMAARVSETAAVTTSFYDPFLKQAFVEEKGYGPALSKQLNHFAELLGPSSSSKCDVQAFHTVCSWEYSQPGNTLRAHISTGGGEGEDWRIGNVMIHYTTIEKLAEASKRYLD